MAKKVLVLGGSYFIGRAIVKTLVYYNFDVTTLNRGTELTLIQGVKTLHADRNDEIQLKNALEGRDFDYVIDVSARNEVQVKMVVQALELNDLKKYVYISSSSVYDFEKCIQPIKEDDFLGGENRVSDYARNKLAAENYLIEQFQDTPIELIILRPPYVYGKHNYLQRESLIFHHLVNDLPIYVPDHGQTRIQFIYVKDLAQTVLNCLSKECGNIAIYNVANKESVTFNEWIHLCEEVTGKKGFIRYVDTKTSGLNAVDFFPFDTQDIVLDTTHAYDVCHKTINFKLGLTEAYKWFKENEHTLLIHDQQLEAEKKCANL